jgi:hypothetical protein
MKKFEKQLVFLFSLIILMQHEGIAQTAAVGFSLGHNGGLGAKIHGVLFNFARGFPLGAQVAIGYTSVDPGNAADARRIFINDATNGTPQQSGHVWDFRADLLYRLNWFTPARSYIYAGIRYASFLGNFKFIGGNEFFDITASQWGLGSGLEIFFPISSRIDLVSMAGIDYFIAGKIEGHDTIYSPDGENINIHHDFTYTDADEAINQPKFEFLIMVGLNYHLGR